MVKSILKFYKSNKFLSVLSIIAIAIIAFYYWSYDVPELWHNAHRLVDIAFQLSLAVIANLVFYIFQVYIPTQKSKEMMRATIERKMESIDSLLESPFSDIAQLYLKDRKQIGDFTDEEMRKILEGYNSSDFLLSWKIADEEKQYCFGEHVQKSFEVIEQTIDELLTIYASYLDDEEKSALIQLKADDFYISLISPFTAFENVTRVVDEQEVDKFKQFQEKYTKVKSIVKMQKGGQH